MSHESSCTDRKNNDETMTEWYRRRLERDRYFTQAIDPSALSSPSPQPSLSSGRNSFHNMSTTAAGTKLAQEIHEEFLTCKICLEGFKTPKSLDCLHTFCEQCIDNHVLNECTYKKYSDYREFTCPLCRKRTQLPLGGVKKLPDNFLVSSLGEVVARQKPSKYPFCDICKLINRKHREASSKCIDCNKLLCKQCVDMHKDTKVTQFHSIFDVEIEKDIECKDHQDEVVRFYCEPCQTCICILCTFNEHKDHEIAQFSDAVSKYKENIQDLLTSCKGKIDVYDRQIALLNKCETVIKSAEQKVRDAAIQYIAEIRNKEKTLIEQLHSIYGAELMEYVGRKNEMQNNLDGLKTTCNLTELVLKGKDIELLLLKKQVQEKLSDMAAVELKDLPSTVGKTVNFYPGTIELGRLEDSDLPLEKRKDAAEIVNDNTPRLALPNMVFGQRRDRDRDILDENKVDKVPVPKCTVDTQTEVIGSPSGQLVNRYIQTEFPESAYERFRDMSSSGSSAGRLSLESRATETDVISTVEKAVNTRSRSLQAMALQMQKTSSEGTPTNMVDTSSSGVDGPASPGTQRRQRRRRERRPVEVSVRPTTGSYQRDNTSDGYGVEGDPSNTISPPSSLPTSAPAPVLTYSSSIDDGTFTLVQEGEAEVATETVTSGGFSIPGMFQVVADIDSPVTTVNVHTCLSADTNTFNTVATNTVTHTQHSVSTSPPKFTEN